MGGMIIITMITTTIMHLNPSAESLPRQRRCSS
jgi:hypothetical protein